MYEYLSAKREPRRLVWPAEMGSVGIDTIIPTYRNRIAFRSKAQP